MKSLRRFVPPLVAVVSVLVGTQAAHAAPAFKTDSSALGYALPDYTPSVDHEGQPRPQGSGPDAAADETG